MVESTPPLPYLADFSDPIPFRVKVSLLKSYHTAEATTGKVFIFKGVSNNVKLDDFKELLDFNKITHAKAERMKSIRSGRDLPFIKIKCDDTRQTEALISGG